jgi:penicillin-binding protein 2
MTVRCTDTIDFYGQKFHCWKKKGHGYMTLKNAIKQSCDIYFYEVARLLGVDRLNETARKFGLGNIVLKDFFDNEKKGVVPSTKWKKEAIGQNWYLGETLITGIGQGYIQTTPLQLTLMTAQLANGGNKIYPTIIPDNNKNIKLIKKQMENNEDLNFPTDYPSLVRNKENVKFVLDGMFRSTNEIYGTSYSSRIEDPKYQFAGKTGTAQVKRITEAERDLDLKLNQIPYKERDHAWYTAFGPYKNPRYALTVLVEHGGSGSSVAAPIAKKLFKKIIDRHEVREKIRIDDTLIS